jgi:sodium/hydrogen antiporter
MSEYPIFIFVALLILVYGVFSQLAEKSVVTAPMFFVTVGILVGFMPHEFVQQGTRAPYVKILTELTLLLVLFLDASTIDLGKLKEHRHLPVRLLLIGLPLTMVLGALLAVPLFRDIPIIQLVLMALILSPTDAALGVAVVTSAIVPERIRQTINVESGLNDGIALPPILICLSVISGMSEEESSTSFWLMFVLKQFLFGPAVGAFVGWAGGRLVEIAAVRGWMNYTFQRLTSVSLAVIAYSSAEMVHGNGFIAAFFSGLFLGMRSKEIRDRIHEFGESESQAMVLFVFLLFGMIIVPIAFPYWDWRALVYGMLSLTVIRMFPVAFSLRKTTLSLKEIWFVGWFGPRGIASVLYLLMVTLEVGIAGYERMLSVIALTVLLSIYLHGLTAVPLSKSFRTNPNNGKE